MSNYDTCLIAAFPGQPGTWWRR